MRFRRLKIFHLNNYGNWVYDEITPEIAVNLMGRIVAWSDQMWRLEGFNYDLSQVMLKPLKKTGLKDWIYVPTEYFFEEYQQPPAALLPEHERSKVGIL